MIVDVHWSILFNAPPFRFSEPGLYAYLHPRRAEVLYIGHADRGPLQRCFEADRRSAIIDFMRSKRRLKTVRVMVGRLIADQQGRLSKRQLSEIAGLLVHRVRPEGNIRASKRLVRSSGLVVQCRGDWPYDQSRYVCRRAAVPRPTAEASISSTLPNHPLQPPAGGMCRVDSSGTFACRG